MGIASATIVLLVSVLVPIPLAGASPIGSVRGHPALTGSTLQAVDFSVDLLPLSTLNVSLVLVANASLSGGSISPGETLTGYANVTVPSTVELSIVYNGLATSVSLPGVGTSYDVPVPGLGINYLGVNLGVFLNFSGVISGTSSISGTGTGGGGNLTWNSSGSRGFPVHANPSAVGGSTVVSSLSNLEYGISMGLDAGAVLPVIGHYVVHLLSFGSVGLVQGHPSEVQSTYAVPVAPRSTATLAGAPIAWVAAASAVTLLALSAFVVLMLHRRRRDPSASRTTGPPAEEEKELER